MHSHHWSTLVPQKYCRDVTDHRAHTEFDNLVPLYRCPGRYTPINYRAPAPSPAQPADPFAGIDEDEGR